MPEWALALIAFVCGLAGIATGYVLGYRNGRVCGELRALHATLAQMRSRLESRPNVAPPRSPAPIRDDE
jgi:hypothetical protein